MIAAISLDLTLTFVAAGVVVRDCLRAFVQAVVRHTSLWASPQAVILARLLWLGVSTVDALAAVVGEMSARAS